jgi:hypothetical protein
LYWLSAILGVVSFYGFHWAKFHGYLRTYYCACAGGVLAALGIGLAVWLLIRINTGARLLVWSHILSIALLSTTVIGVREVAGLWAPPWPAYELRPAKLACAKLGEKGSPTLDGWRAHPFNSWGVRDLERSLKKDNGVRRIAFVGDSFLEGLYCSYPIPLLCEKKLHDQGHAIECVNLGISATSPIHYYYRIKTIALKCAPDVVYMFVYSGNDYVNPDEYYQCDTKKVLTTFFAERPMPSLLGIVAPQLDWLVADRLGASEMLAGKTPVSGESEWFHNVTTLPYEEGIQQVSTYVHEHDFPKESVERIKAILGRGGQSFWAAFRPRLQDEEHLERWIIANTLSWELSNATPARSVKDIPDSYVTSSVAATATWVNASYVACKKAGVRFKAFVAPVGLVDPEFVAFWKPWPIAFSWNYYCQARHLAMIERLRQLDIPHVDLAPTLQNVSGTYRKSDQHWNELGHEIVSQRVLQEIAADVRDLDQ